MISPEAWSYGCVALIGITMGSAVTALAYRIPRGRSWVHGRSACTQCGHVLGPVDLIPVVSWVVSRGRCRHCQHSVSWRYPVTELLCGLWAVLLFQHVGMSWALPLLGLWGFLLIALLWIDLDFQLLPDALTFPGTMIAVAAALTIPEGARHALLGVVVGSGMLWLIAELYLRVRKIEGMGFGDVKLAAMFGAVLGWQLTLITLFLAALAGSLWGGVLIASKRGDRMTALPFGTLLAPAALIAFLWGTTWLNAYLRFMR